MVLRNPLVPRRGECGVRIQLRVYYTPSIESLS